MFLSGTLTDKAWRRIFQKEEEEQEEEEEKQKEEGRSATRLATGRGASYESQITNDATINHKAGAWLEKKKKKKERDVFTRLRPGAIIVLPHCRANGGRIPPSRVYFHRVALSNRVSTRTHRINTRVTS